MLNGYRLALDNQSEVFGMLVDHANETFYDFSTVNPQPHTVYVLGRQQLLDNMPQVRGMCENPDFIMVFNNSAEGSWTMETQMKSYKIAELVRCRRLLLIAGAAVTPDVPCLTHEYFLSKILDFDETFEAQQRTPEIFAKRDKPYKFLFLNGRARPHRKYIYERLRRTNLLNQSLYTMLDAKPCVWRSFIWQEGDLNVMATPTTLVRLPDHYEVPRYRNPHFVNVQPERSFLKQDLFRMEWGEIYLYPPPYIDTYFSLVTETVCAESTAAFRTEKIAKPLAMGHPFIVASTVNFYKELKNLGFRTFDQLIDESFDQIDNAQVRVDRLLTVVEDLCQQDLGSFLDQCRPICIHNQQRLQELAQEQRQIFPTLFHEFINRHARS